MGFKELRSNFLKFAENKISKKCQPIMFKNMQKKNSRVSDSLLSDMMKRRLSKSSKCYFYTLIPFL